ncbi:MAG: hypothetical protein H8D23_08455 [Candidatus Brocadiales bacterium]|nr:hypothetical protein [Candidatus Brocadiales bacterium]
MRKHTVTTFVGLILAGLVAVLCGCASTIDSFSNNTSGDMIRGFKLQGGVDTTSGNPVPSVSLKIGSFARKGKSDRMAMIMDNNTTNIVADNYDVGITYQNFGSGTNVRQLIQSETRTPTDAQVKEGIFVYQEGSIGMPITSGNLFNTGGKSIISIGSVGTSTAQAVANAK